MIYRRIKADDYVKVVDFCKKHSINYDGRTPFIGFLAIDGSEVHGIIFSHNVALIEPFIAEESNVALKLFYLMEGALSATNTQIIAAYVNGGNNKLIKETGKVGFVQLNNQYTLFKKEL